MLRFAKLLSTAVSSARRVLTAQLRGFGAEGDDDNAEPIEGAAAGGGVEVLQPLGLMSRPIAGAHTEAVVIDVRDGDEQIAIVMIDKSGAAQNVEEGESRLYSPAEGTCVIRLRASGKIEITAKSGQDVVVNGGTLKIARDSDPVRVGTLAGTAGPYPVNFTFTPQNADGVPGAPSVGPTVTLAGVISNAGGAANAKA